QSRGVVGAGLFADAALATADVSKRAEHLALAAARRGARGNAGTGAAGGSPPPPVPLPLFGGVGFETDRGALHRSGLKPRVRALLRLLAMQGGRPLHREVIQVALWPEAPADAAGRNLHVAMSSLRQALEPGVARAGFTVLVRDGDAYRLATGAEV